MQYLKELIMNYLFLLSTLTDRLAKTHVIVGLCLAILGFALSLLARRIASVCRPEDQRKLPVENSNKVYIMLKGFGLVFLLVALIIMMFE